jgi:mannosylglycerate hydrolase
MTEPAMTETAMTEPAMTETLWLVPHTHWDREWYEPFQRFRLRLVDLLDDVIARAEADPTFSFTLDGQLAVVDDYLEVRPEAAARIAALVRSGQFAVGPWAILLDEFLCSGENIIRNLQWGLRRGGELGTVMAVGYLPDMFGHCAQMPQLLALAGLRQACVWRGVPAAIDHHAFVWTAPDGTGLRTEYLPGGYGNAAELFADPERLAEAAGEHLTRARPWFGVDPVLAMYGTDHSAPLPWIASAVAALNAREALPRVRLATLAGYLDLFDPEAVAGLPVWHGELRSHARANILPGVISNRPHLKRGLSGAERMVERYAEPLAALWSPAAHWPARLLELAWQRLVQCSCHDSVTGCGVDETAVQVAARIAEAEQIGRGLRDRVLADLAARTPADAVLVVNPSPRRRTDIASVTVPAASGPPVAVRLPDGSVGAFQETANNSDTVLFAADRSAQWIAAGLAKGSLGLDFLGRTVQAVEVTGARELTVTMGRAGPGLTAEHRALAPSVAAAGGDWRIVVVEEPLRTGYVAVSAPPLGFTQLGAAHPATPPPPVAEVSVSDRRLTNGLLTVEAAPDGTLTLSTMDEVVLSGVGRLDDGDDLGDLYNYAPPPREQAAPGPDRVDIEVAQRGPLVGALRIHREYPWRARTGVTMTVELRAGERFCRLELAFTNNHPDHRVRLHVPLARPATESHAEGQFAVVRRGLHSEGGHGESPLPTFPAYSFVDAGGAAVLLDQVSEYEVVGGGRELAVTLLRATGLISRAEHPLRAEPAGPVIATPQAQLLGQEVRTRLAVLPHAGGWAQAGVAEAAEDFRCPFVVTGGLAPVGGELAERAGLAVSGDGVVLSSLRRRDEAWLELRVVAMTDAPTVARIGHVSVARRADLLGNAGTELSVVDGWVDVPLRPWEIATVQVVSRV